MKERLKDVIAGIIDEHGIVYKDTDELVIGKREVESTALEIVDYIFSLIPAECKQEFIKNIKGGER